MPPVSTVALAIVLSTAVMHAGAREHTRYLELINRAHDSVISLAIAAAGSDAFREMSLGGPLGGGGRSAMIEVAGDTCVYDLRLTFRNGRTQVYKDVDVCRYRSLRIRPLPRVDDGGPR